ncbi:RNA polymerase sigma factor [Sorangium sp. So ce233]|uniref:RNA polymerase sigma factor n=1 Tax=Sorangium sp. So ce233 TaxID=3133290 RepID=UPI003F635ECC
MAMLIELTRLLPWARGSSTPVAEPLSLVAVHDQYVGVVWRWLQRLGVHEPDLEDLLQEVFEVVHHQLSTFDTSRPIRPWLFGICKNVVRRHRRRAYVRLETTEPETQELSSEGVIPDPEEVATARQDNEELNALLEELDPAKRVVFVMFELDDLSCQEIAEELGIPEGTVHSRLHAARKAFQSAVSRRKARIARGGGT